MCHWWCRWTPADTRRASGSALLCGRSWLANASRSPPAARSKRALRVSATIPFSAQPPPLENGEVRQEGEVRQGEGLLHEEGRPQVLPGRHRWQPEARPLRQARVQGRGGLPRLRHRVQCGFSGINRASSGSFLHTRAFLFHRTPHCTARPSCSSSRPRSPPRPRRPRSGKCFVTAV